MLLKFLSVFLLGVLSGYYFSVPQQATALPPGSSDVFQALVSASSLPIPKQHLSCEVVGPSRSTAEGMEYLDTKVGDYIAFYVLWSHNRTRNSSSSLSCEGDAVKKCTWVFGESKSNEGWNRFLIFDYNPTTKSVAPDSLKCIDVP